MPNDNSRNTIIFIVCALALLGLYQVFVMGPAERRSAAEQKSKAAAAGVATSPAAQIAASFVSRPQALTASPRVKIETPALTGSISLKGARLDDLFLTGYRETLKKDSPPVELFRPEGVQFAFFTESGWSGQNLAGLPDKNTVWTVKEGSTLTPATPVTLTYDNGAGLVFDRKVEVDKEFMFTVTDTVTNRAETPITLAPYSTVQRQGLPNPKGVGNVHEGGLGVIGAPGKYRLKLHKYKPWKKDAADAKKAEDYQSATTGGWFGITDKYWLAALVPSQKEAVTSQFRVSTVSGIDVYDANFVGTPRTLAPNTTATSQSHIFAGAKRVTILRAYGDALGIPRFVDAVDWGTMYFFTKPIFWLIEFFNGYVRNFGIAILMMTVVVKIAFFYPANLSFSSMTKMKKVQPQMDALKLRFKDDPPGLQQAMMQLYKEEKINPMLGCLPMLATIPIFLSLFKVLNVSIEMRHAPFFGWIQDLSAPDPTSIWNLFGLIPYHPDLIPLIGGVLNGPLHLGAWPLLYGLTMWLTQSMSPPAADKTQQQIIMYMPLIFTFVMTQLAAGLLIYYVWSNLLTIIQQYVIMRRFKVDNPIDKIIRRVTGKPDPVPG